MSMFWQGHLLIATAILMCVMVQAWAADEAHGAAASSSTPATKPSASATSRPPAAAKPDWQKMPEPVASGPFVQPADAPIARPVWGHREGLRVGLSPMPGPRGLLKIYAPYLGQDAGRVINFIAIEPIVQGQTRRGFSELEPSKLDSQGSVVVHGKRFWAADSAADFAPRQPEVHPARGVISREGDVQVLRVYVMIEPFDSGASPYIRLTFRSDRPYEVGLATFARSESKPLSACIVTATMGNYGRLRQLHLADKVVVAKDLWPQYDKDAFAPHKTYGLGEMFRTPGGGILVPATSDEPAPQDVKAAWQYIGKPATQYWRCEAPHKDIIVRVNGRFMYWMSRTPIPGGIAFENFELTEPFSQGAEYWFGVTTQTPAQLRATNAK